MCLIKYYIKFTYKSGVVAKNVCAGMFFLLFFLVNFCAP